jgi:PEP-CTERM motif
MKTQEIQAEATLTPVLNQRHRLRRFAAFAILFACTLLVSTARADTVTFSFSYICNSDLGSCPTNLEIGGLGQPASDSLDMGNMATVKSDVPGYTNPVPITTGYLNFTTAAATRIYFDPPHTYLTWYDLSGGSGFLNGSVLGVTGTRLLTINPFLPVGQGYYDGASISSYDGPFKGVLNQDLLAVLGLPAGSGSGYGTITDSEYFSGQFTYYDMTITFTPTPTPEPGSLALFGSGIVGLAGVLRRRLKG